MALNSEVRRDAFAPARAARRTTPLTPPSPAKNGLMEEVADFLAKSPPFDALSRDDLLAVAAAVAVRTHPAGTDILDEDGPPAPELFVIGSGAIELRHQDEIVDILEPGESFGHPSLL